MNETFRSDRGKCRQKRYFVFNLWTWWWKWHVWSLSGTWLIRHFLVLPFSLSNHIYSFTLRYLTTFKGRRSFSAKIHKCHYMNHKSSNLSPDHISFWNPSVLKPLLFLSDQLTRDGTHSERISKRPANNKVQFYDFLCICIIVLFLAIISRIILCLFLSCFLQLFFLCITLKSVCNCFLYLSCYFDWFILQNVFSLKYFESISIKKKDQQRRKKSVGTRRS